MKRFLFLTLAVAACGVGPTETPAALKEPTRVSLQNDKAAVQAAITTLTTSILSGDAQALSSISLPEAGDVKRLARFIETQKEGLQMTYGNTAPLVADILPGEDGAFDVSLTIEGAAAQNESKRIHMYKDPSGKIYFAGARPYVVQAVSGVSLAAEGSLAIAQASATTWGWKYNDYAPLSGVTWMFGTGNGTACPDGTQSQHTRSPNLGIQYQNTVCVADSNSCAAKIATGSGTGAGCIGGCCWFNIFGDDIWWNTNSGGYDGRGTYCHLTSWCPNDYGR